MTFENVECEHLLVGADADRSAPGWLRADEEAFRLPADLAAELDALPLGPVTRYRTPVARTDPPEAPG